MHEILALYCTAKRLVGKEVTQPAMASIPLLTPHSHTAVVYREHVRHPIWPWSANLTQRSNSMPHMPIKVRRGVTGIFLIFAQHLTLLGEIGHCLLFLCFWYGEIEVHASKNEQPIRRLHYKMQGVDLWPFTKCKEWFDWSRVFVTSWYFSLWPLGLFGIEFGVMSQNLVPKFGAQIHYFNISKGR